MTLDEALADYLRDYRRTHQLSQADLGRRLGCSQALVNKLERGNPRDWRADSQLTLLTCLAEVVGLSVVDLVAALDARCRAHDGDPRTARGGS